MDLAHLKHVDNAKHRAVAEPNTIIRTLVGSTVHGLEFVGEGSGVSRPLTARLQELLVTTHLPDQPDYGAINSFIIEAH